MAEIRLTSSQQAVVDNRGGALLVSAAAGSGKTKVLVDRLLSRICDPVTPCNIDDFLVITYTNAAAAELRLKIAQALSQRLAEDPNNRHLQQQMRRIYLAEISTVHAFCSSLLRTYAYKLNIPGDFRMIEENEAASLQKKVIDTMLEHSYAEFSDEFRIMVETFGYGRNDSRLTEAILMANKAMRCRADMEKWEIETLAALDISNYDDVMQTPWGKYIVQEFRAFLKQQITHMKEACCEMQRYPNIEKSYGEVFFENLRQLEELYEKDNWDSIIEGRIESFGKLKPLRAPEDVAVKERLSRNRKKCWSDLQKWQQLFYAKSADLLDDLMQVMPGTQALIRFASKFDKEYSEEKKSKKLLDFSDLEHLAIRLLTDRYTGQPTEIAREVSSRFTEIMVDEYQDSNQVQEVIFEAVSRSGKNRFMVGDVKQSIYRFRLADPMLFLRKYEEYPDYDQAENGRGRRILLSENFRSRPEILSACNDVFRLIMRKQVGDLDYGEEEELKPGREFRPLPQPLVELHCLTTSDADKNLEKRSLEAEFVAQRIRTLLDDQTPVTDADTSRPIKPSDIVILMRSVSANAATYLRALEQKGIPAVCNQGGSLLDATEIQVLIAMLRVIDNPHQDVPLLTVLASPVFGFSPDALAHARATIREGDFYSAIQGNEEFKEFLTLLDHLREESLWVPLHELVERVICDTGLRTVFSAMPDGEQRGRNIAAFSDFVVNFETNGTRVLPQILGYLTSLQESGGMLPVPQSASDHAVTIMSIHKSKGLEFPVVFLCDLSRQFNMKDMQEAILVDDELAVGCNRVDSERFVRYPTIAKKSIEHKKRKESISEELRVLYVAMTRPRDMLIMTYYSKRLMSELEALNSQLTMPLSDELCSGVNNPGKWLLLAALCRTEAGELLQPIGGNDVSMVSKYPWVIKLHHLRDEQETERSLSLEDVTVCKESKPILHASFPNYPFDGVCDIPIKLTATQLKGRRQDEEAAEGAQVLWKRQNTQFRKADFVPKQLTAAERGTATHLFMQFASYHSCSSKELIERELSRLCDAGFLTKEQAEAVETERILRFFASDLGRWLLQQREVRREFKFSLLVDSDQYLPEVHDELLMLQGVVDCFVIEKDGIVILDFKTDRIDWDIHEKAEQYRPQLDAYGKALERIYGMPVCKKILYFFGADKAIEV